MTPNQCSDIHAKFINDKNKKNKKKQKIKK